jgi:SAM-dependent methyltransferase
LVESNLPISPASRFSTILYGLTIFVSAFLLFQVQPIIAKVILPWFGGSSAVWSTCMLFFQLILLAGYAYAHWLQGLAGRTQAILHSVLLALSLALLPILPGERWKPNGAGSETGLILLLLLATIGAPYFLLSSTSPLLQAWYSRERGVVPYRLFALSNLASMLALLTYPVLIEPNFPTRLQGVSWSVAYGLFAVLCAVTGWRASHAGRADSHAPEAAPVPPPATGTRLLWLALAATASTLLLTVTNFLTQDVAAIPFLWVLPLSAYLLTFIICFESPRWYNRAVFLPLAAASLLTFAWFLIKGLSLDMKIAIAFSNLALFGCCMFCHGELVRLKPDPRYLTGFYMFISLGGAIGGIFVGLIAPNLFNAYYEFDIGLAVCALLLAWAVYQALRRWNTMATKIITVAFTVAVGIYIGKLGLVVKEGVTGYIAVARNFYGQLRVIDEGKPTDEDADRKLLHGRINHGIQMLNPKYRRSPVAYFCLDSGIGHAMRTRLAGKPWDMGILGLGAGALAAYGQAGDTIHLYEINPLVLDLARTQFTYLADTPAKVEVSLGDGRLSLERDTNARFDILVMDAFSGDSVPVHLITREAFAMYFRHLKPGGILAVNISNRYLDLQPVMERAATAFGKRAIVMDLDPEADDLLCNTSSWTLIVDANAPIPEMLKTGRVIPANPAFKMWTDDFSNMFSILK